MNHCLTVSLSMLLLVSSQVQGISAFPGAEGYGAESAGGRGGKVVYVTNLNDNGPGSLREALMTTGPRTIVFKTGGTIRLTSRLKVSDSNRSNFTVAGQTAPGGGICIRGYPLEFTNVSDVIIRFIRIRLGINRDTREGDCVTAKGVNDFILDHVTATWSNDETITIANNDIPDLNPIRNVTVQRCIVAEIDEVHSTGSIIGTSNEPQRDRATDMCVHHCLFIHTSHRFPNIGGDGNFKVINNVIYNWRARLTRVDFSANLDVINNYYKIGPVLWSQKSGGRTAMNRYLHKYTFGSEDLNPSIYTKGNLIIPDIETDPSADNWWWWQVFLDYGSYKKGDPLPTAFKRTEKQAPCVHPITVQNALDAYTSVIADVGANARVDEDGNYVSNSDPVDAGYFEDCKNGTGPTEYGRPESKTYPNLAAGTAYPDQDEDGISDTWENSFFGDMDQGGKDNSSSDYDGDGYSDLEEFLNGTNPIDAAAEVPGVRLRASSGRLSIGEAGQIELFDCRGRRLPPARIFPAGASRKPAGFPLGVYVQRRTNSHDSATSRPVVWFGK